MEHSEVSAFKGEKAMLRIYALGGLAVVLAMIGGLWLATQSGAEDDQFASCRASQVAGGDIGGPFELLNAEGQTVADTDVITEPTLVYFGYTFCPDVCPLDTARNAEAVDLLAERRVSSTPVFITIDPKRDTPEVVGEYAENMHEKMIGLSGSAEQIKAASQAYKTYYKEQPGDEDYYLVDHSTFTYLVLPAHGVVEFFRRESTAEQIADTVQCYADKL